MNKRLSFLVCVPRKWHDGPGCLPAQHPEIHLPEAKELHFFDDDKPGPSQPCALHRHFQLPAAQLWGEATPISLYWDQQQSESGATTRPCLSVILRNPIERAYSHSAEHHRGNDPLPFALALEKEGPAAAQPCRCSTSPPTSTAAFIALNSGDSGVSSAESRYCAPAGTAPESSVWTRSGSISIAQGQQSPAHTPTVATNAMVPPAENTYAIFSGRRSASWNTCLAGIAATGW